MGSELGVHADHDFDGLDEYDYSSDESELSEVWQSGLLWLGLTCPHLAAHCCRSSAAILRWGVVACDVGSVCLGCVCASVCGYMCM